MGRKKFDQELYNKSDPLSNGIMVRWLDLNGYKHIESKEDYKVDIVCMKDGIPAYFETEIKYSWVRQWPNDWMEIRIPYRKKKIVDKWVRDGSKGPLTFIIFRSDCKQAWFINGLAVRNSKVDTLNTKYTTHEKFYHIDVNDANLINMEKPYDITEEFINVKYPS